MIGISAVLQRVIDDVLRGGDLDALPLLVALLLVLATLRFAISFLRRYATARVGIRCQARLRAELYAGYLRFPRAFYDLHATGQVVSRATNDLDPVRYFIGWGVVQGAQSAMMITGVATALFLVDPPLAALSLLPLPLVALLTWRFVNRSTPIWRRLQQARADVTEAADEAVVGIQMVQAFGREAVVRERFRHHAGRVRDDAVLGATVEARFLPAIANLPNLAVAVVLLVGGLRVIDGALSLGEFVFFYSLLVQLIWPLEAVGWIIDLGQRCIAAAGRAYAWLDAVPALAEAAAPTPLPAGPLDLRFTDVRFRYGTDGDEVLRGVDLAVGAGEIVAVCGATASGTTSLLQLVPRLHDPTAGAVLLGGVPIADAPLADVRRAVALVTQRPILFSASLRENLVLGRPDASDDDLAQACAAAGVSWFLDELPDGLETLIGERGVNLSGGQRQRVALARALLVDARVLVLDDPLSAVDTIAEHRLVESLGPALAGRTVILCAQRLSTVELAHRAVVLAGGRIVEEGAPAELLARGGPFAELFGDEAAA